MGVFKRQRISVADINDLRQENWQLRNALKASQGFEKQLLKRLDAKYSEFPLDTDPRVRLLFDVISVLKAILVTYDRAPGRYTSEQLVEMVRLNLDRLFANLSRLQVEAADFAAEQDAEEDEVRDSPNWHGAEDTFSFLSGDSDEEEEE